MVEIAPVKKSGHASEPNLFVGGKEKRQDLVELAPLVPDVFATKPVNVWSEIEASEA